MVTTRPPKTIVKPTALGPVANTDTKLLIYGLFQKRPSFGTGRELRSSDVPVRDFDVAVQIESVREPCVQALDDTAAYLFG